jgi:hypothetical protein
MVRDSKSMLVRTTAAVLVETEREKAITKELRKSALQAEQMD